MICLQTSDQLVDFLKPRPRKGMERAPEWSQEIRGQFSGNLYWENHCIVCVLSWLISYTWGFLPWECCWSVSGMIIIIVSGGKERKHFLGRRQNIFEQGEKILVRGEIFVSEEPKLFWARRGKERKGIFLGREDRKCFWVKRGYLRARESVFF